MSRDRARLSRTVAHALRHEPEAYGLELDPQGWAPLDDLLEALRGRRGWRGLEEEDLRRMIGGSRRRRFEIREGRIRALYGHSVPVRVEEMRAAPPESLYHGTSPAAARRILSAGILPMDRRHVHLSPDRETARRVGRRKADPPTILRVRAAEAEREGVAFYRAGKQVWLADRVPPRYVERLGESGSGSR